MFEKLFPDQKVEGGRLYYCTQAGGFSEVVIPLDATTRSAASQAVEVVGKALELGFLPAYDEKAGEVVMVPSRLINTSYSGDRETRSGIGLEEDLLNIPDQPRFMGMAVNSFPTKS